MKVHKWKDVQARRFKPEQIEASRKRAEEEILEMNLRALREKCGKTQVELAQLAGMAQGEVSRAEHRRDHLVSTLRKVVEALDGELEVNAVIGGQRVRLTGV